MTPSDAFLGRLKHLVLGHPVLRHPLWTDLELGYYDREALKRFSVHYYHHVLRTRLYDAAALAACPDERIQAALASVLWDEYGAGDSARTHPEQFRRVLRALEIDVAAADRAPRLPELEAYSRIHFGLCRPASFWEAMGAVGFAMEWPIPYLYEPIVRGYRRIAGLTDGDLTFFLEHIPTDEAHGSLMVESIRPHLGDEAVRDALVRGAMASMDARERLAQAIATQMESLEVVR
jgi:pyrroloquinoline-quinone synthase